MTKIKEEPTIPIKQIENLIRRSYEKGFKDGLSAAAKQIENIFGTIPEPPTEI